jgi:hypothetical protein
MIDGGQWAHLMVLLFAKTSLPCLGAHCPFNPLFQLAESKVKIGCIIIIEGFDLISFPEIFFLRQLFS